MFLTCLCGFANNILHDFGPTCKLINCYSASSQISCLNKINMDKFERPCFKCEFIICYILKSKFIVRGIYA